MEVGKMNRRVQGECKEELRVGGEARSELSWREEKVQESRSARGEVKRRVATKYEGWSGGRRGNDKRG